MERLALMCEGRNVGELCVVRQGEDTVFSARCRQRQGLWCVWAVGQDGEVRLGCPEVQDGELKLSRRFSRRMTAAAGTVLRGELRTMHTASAPQWERVVQPEALFSLPELCSAVRSCAAALTRPAGQGRLLALPYCPEKPIPLPEMFCFASIRTLQGGEYAVFTLDEAGWPTAEK